MARIQYIPNRVIDANGISDGARIYLFQSGTSTPVPLFQDPEFTTAIPNPIVVPTGAEVPVFYTSYAGDLRLRVVEYSGVVSMDEDPYSPPLDQLSLSGDNGASLIGTADGDSAQAKLDKAVYRGVPFNSAFPLGTQPIAPASALMDINADRDTGDLMHMQTRHRLGMAGYSLHITDTADSGVVAGGAAGFAISGQGYGDAIVGNRYEQGDGNGLLVNRVGTGNGSGIKANFSSLGNGHGAYIIKQPASGIPGTASGVGHGLYVENASTNGFAISSYTQPECAETISNVFERGNTAVGLITDARILRGGTRTGTFTGTRTLLQPSTAWNGAFAVSGLDVGINPNVTGAPDVTGIFVDNNAAGNTSVYGARVNVLGVNSVNIGLLVNVSGGTGANIAAQLLGEVQLGGNMLPTAANTYQLGSSGLPFTTIYVQNAPVVVSDRNQKQGIRDLNEAEARVANACKALIRVYQLNSEVERDGDGARLHIGSIAQDIAEAFESEGLDAFKYGVVFRDDEGRHGVAYQELFAMIIATL